MWVRQAFLEWVCVGFLIRSHANGELPVFSGMSVPVVRGVVVPSTFVSGGLVVCDSSKGSDASETK